MGSVTLSMQNRLFWLGRYSERVYMTVQYMMEQYDLVVDGKEIDFADYCTRMGIPNDYTDSEDFCRRYLFDKSSPYSVISAAEQMIGNGMVLRETISTDTLAYLQMACNALDLAAQSDGPEIQLQWVLDDIMAFRGSMDDSVEAEGARNIAKSGGLVERISIMLRLDRRLERLDMELQKLVNRLYKTDLTVNQTALEVVTQKALHGKDIPRDVLINNIEWLFLV